MGSATAYHLATSGATVLVLEQFQRGHTFGSSHGQTRIIRFFYDKPFYTELMKTAYAEWRDLDIGIGEIAVVHHRECRYRREGEPLWTRDTPKFRCRRR